MTGAGEQMAAGGDSAGVAREIARISSGKLAEDVVALDLRPLVGYADFMIVMSARNPRQTRAVHDEIREQMKEQGRVPARVEGFEEGDWILMDYLDCVVHIFTPALRERYRLESLWGEAPRLDLVPEDR